MPNSWPLAVEPASVEFPGCGGWRPLLAYLREIGVVAVPVPVSTPLEVLLGQYRSWLVQERGLAAATVLRYENTARRFLQEQARGGGHRAGVLDRGGRQRVSAAGVRSGFGGVGEGPGGRAAVDAAVPVPAQGITALRLGTAVPPVGGWRLATLPPPR